MFHYRLDGGSFTSVPLVPLGGDLFEATLPPADCSWAVEFYFAAEGSLSGEVTNPPGGPAAVHAPSVGAFVDLFADDFETDQGWTVQNDGALTDGAWDRGVPVGGGDRGDPPTDADGSGQCYLTDNVDDNSDVDNGSTTLLSPIMDATQGTPVVAYYRWYSNIEGGEPMQDIFVVEVSDNGGTTWVNLETVGPAGSEVVGGWIYKEFLLTDVPGISLTDELRIRFIASDTDPQSIVEAGVDDVKLTTFTCEDVVISCPADVTGDGVVNSLDLIDLLLCLGQPPNPPCDTADVNQDGAVNSLDLIDLLLELGTSCP